MSFKKVAIFILLISFIGCASPIKHVKDPNMPFHRPYYSILPPQGEGWVYAYQGQSETSGITFFKKLSGTHTRAGFITEKQVYSTFDTPEEFLKFGTKGIDLNTDPRRFKDVDTEIALDDKFGNYSMKYYSVTEDHNAVNKGSHEFLLFNVFEYFFIHPQFNNIIIDIQFSERGLPEEIDPNFKETAKRFIDGLVLKNK